MFAAGEKIKKGGLQLKVLVTPSLSAKNGYQIGHNEFVGASQTAPPPGLQPIF